MLFHDTVSLLSPLALLENHLVSTKQPRVNLELFFFVFFLTDSTPWSIINIIKSPFGRRFLDHLFQASWPCRPKFSGNKRC